MGEQQVLLALGGLFGTAVVGVCAMVVAGLDMAVGAPIIAVMVLVSAACFVCAWGLAGKNDNDESSFEPTALPDLRAVDCPKIKELLDDDSERRKIVELMRNGALTTWAHCKWQRDQARLKPDHWNNASLVYEIVDGKPVTNVLPNNEKRIRPWSKEPVPARIEYWHDVWFNREQLRKHWPGGFSPLRRQRYDGRRTPRPYQTLAFLRG